MVETNKDAIARKISEVEIIDMPQEELNWGSVSLSEVLNSDTRLEASVYNIEGRHAREILKKCKWELSSFCGDNGLATAYHRPRFKRIWVEKSPFPIYQPSQILEVYPKPSGYISEATKTDIEELRVKKGQILLTCSGTIGSCSIVSKTLDNKIFSHDLIRIDCKDEIDIGYVYAFLKTKIGNTLINTNNYGAVVSHIEPEHLNNIPIPNPPSMLKKQIHELVMKSYELRDESNELLDKAEELMVNELRLPPIDDFKPEYFDTSSNLKNYSVKFSELSNRFEASFHVPIVKSIINHLKSHAEEVTTIGDERISKKIILPGRFKRVYVEEGQGTVFFGGKQIYELDPSNKKYLSTRHHKNRIQKELRLIENMVLITCSGTIGKTALVPKHWENWTMNQHVIRIIPSSDSIAGYLYVFLSSPYGYELIKRFTYGSVVDEIDDNHVSQIEIPLINRGIQDEINRLALEANKLRYEAYKLEQQALIIVNEEVIHKR
ncbi:restriction endonuclease subunit S [Thermicanus aegyptius]|uniref:restriction endonuclease subunit S n=1 Tax=Thermicanus aegyptius TaxID=94009 RepID=UPI00041DB74D|nr:restriction endonuclease subunit S [Thermicanus aegyptius]